MTTWRPVREDDRLDPGDKVRFAPDAVARYGFSDAMHVVDDGFFGVTVRVPAERAFGCFDMLLVNRMDLEVPR